LITLVALSYLHSSSGGLRFKKHESLGKQITQDTYYDRNGLLRKGFIFVGGMGPKSSSLVSQDDLSLDATASAAILGVPLDASIL
jgi:hypothetical protein